jgi:hypothetical protein
VIPLLWVECRRLQGIQLMKRSSLAIVGLSVALVVSSTVWLHEWLDAAVSYSYLEDSYRHARGTAMQALALLPEVARAGATKGSVLGAASSGAGTEGFEKVG